MVYRKKSEIKPQILFICYHRDMEKNTITFNGVQTDTFIEKSSARIVYLLGRQRKLFNGDLKRYKGNFTHYEKVREVELQTLMAEYEKQQDEIAKLQDFIRRFGVQATKAAQAQDILQMYLQRLQAMPTQMYL